MPRHVDPLDDLMALDEGDAAEVVDDLLDQLRMATLYDYEEYDTKKGSRKTTNTTRRVWCDFVDRIYLPSLRRLDTLDPVEEDDLEVHPLDFTHHEVSIRRAKSFLMLSMHLAVARQSHPTTTTIKSKREAIFNLMRDSLAAQAEKGYEAAAVASVFGDKSRYGLQKRVIAACDTIVNDLDLPEGGGEPRPTYGRYEYDLITLALLRQLSTKPKDARKTLSLLCANSLAYVAGPRQSTFAPKNREDRPHMRGYDFRVRRHLPLGGGSSSSSSPNVRKAWIVHINARCFKGQTPSTRKPVGMDFGPLERYENILMEPAVYFIDALIASRCLYEKGEGGKLIESIDDLENSDAYEFEGRGSQPIFCHPDGTQMTASELTRGIAEAADSVGLEAGSLHCYRRDVATETAIAKSPEAGMLVVGHAQPTSQFHQHYTPGINMVPLMALRSGEGLNDEQKEALRQTGYYLDAINRAAADVAASGGVAKLESLSLDDIWPRRAQAQQRDNVDTLSSYSERIERALVQYKQMTGLMQRYEECGQQVLRHLPRESKCSREKIARSMEGTTAVLAGLLGSFKRSQKPTDPLLAQAVDEARVVARKIGALVGAVTARAKDQGEMVTSTRSVLESRQAILDLKESTKRALRRIAEGAKTADDEEDEGLITDEGSGRGNPLLTSYVRLGFMRLLLGVVVGQERFDTVVEHISDRLKCCFCPPDERGILPRCGLFPGPAQPGMVVDASAYMDRRRQGIAEHLHHYHEEISEALLAGQQLNLGCFNDLPFWHPGILAQFAPRVARRFLVPARGWQQSIPSEEEGRPVPLSQLPGRRKRKSDVLDTPLVPSTWLISSPTPQRKRVQL